MISLSFRKSGFTKDGPSEPTSKNKAEGKSILILNNVERLRDLLVEIQNLFLFHAPRKILIFTLNVTSVQFSKY